MSVVVAKVEGNKITVSSDSGCYQGWGIIPTRNMKTSKLEKVNGTILGGVGSAEETQLFFDYMKTHVIDVVDREHIRRFLKEFQDYKVELGLPKELNNSYILATKGQSFAIDGMFVSEITTFWAIGAGQDYANGALYMGATAEQAVEAARALCAFVGGEIKTETIER